MDDGAVLGTRALNRALLALQHLLVRADVPVLDLVEHLVGLQAQEPQEPYVGVWSRLHGFEPAQLSGLLEARTALRRLHDPMLVARMRGTLGRRLPGVDEEALAAAGRPLFAATASTLTEVARDVGGQWPKATLGKLA